MTANALISVSGLNIGFTTREGYRQIVHDAAFELLPGQCLALVGESGSGKSVTARTLLGLTGANARVSAKTLQLDGQDLRGLGERSWQRIRGARVGYVLQDALVSLNPLRTIGQEVGDALKIHTTLSAAQRTEKVLQLLAAAGISEPEQRISQRSGELSGGLRQRALIASAIALDPPVLIADEPTTALDATVQAQVLQLLDERKRTGTGLILISHDMAVVAQLADHVAVMRQGRIVEAGPTAAVLGDPQHEYTRALLRAIPTDKPRGTRLSTQPVRISDRQHGLISAQGVRRSETDAPVLSATGLRKQFRGPSGTVRTAVDGVSFALGRGQTLGLVGESGSGKSTVARMSLGLAMPDAGEVRLLGEPWAPLPERQRRSRRGRITAIYQDPLGSFDPQWSVGKILSDALPLAGRLSRGQRRNEVRQLLDLVGLRAQFAERLPLRLSGGQRQRVAIARALAPNPEVIVCDEPVSALDVSIQAQVLDLLDQLQHEFQLSYLFISHDLGVIQHVSDELLVMRQGRIVEAGRTAEVFSHPTEPYTRQLLAAAPRLPSYRA